MNIHEFIKTIVDNKHLYNEDEYMKLCDIAHEEYHKYLKRKFFGK